MPNRSRRAIRAATLAAFSAALIAPTAQAADDVVAELRVVSQEGVLESGTSYVTNSERIKTDPRARCFVGGEGGSGDRVRLAGPTAMGMLETAGDANPDLSPLSVTDEFGFGLGLCGIGGVEGDSDRFWSITVNHQASQVGGDQITLSQGDDVLWSLTGFPPDPELQLTRRAGHHAGDAGRQRRALDLLDGLPAPRSGLRVRAGDRRHGLGWRRERHGQFVRGRPGAACKRGQVHPPGHP